ncbi:ATP-binding protein [Shewanella algae]|uniref:ATP-binding protein n=1 Tax=Shewanella algae TaxID=38313 RepID=UPI00399990F1
MFSSEAQTEFPGDWSRLLIELAKLQLGLTQGQDVLPALCQTLVHASGAEALLMVERSELGANDMPESVTCWCRDPVIYLTLWSSVNQWAKEASQQELHQWLKFTVWPIKDSDLLLFFHSSAPGWFESLASCQASIGPLVGAIYQCQLSRSSSQSAEDELCFKAVIDGADSLLLLFSLEPEREPILYANPAATAVTLYANRELVGANLTGLLFEGEESDSFREQLRRKGSYTGELWCHKGDGGRELLHLNCYCISQSRRIYAVIGRDYSEQHQLQQAVARTQKMQAIGELVGGIAHDFNNILGVLKGNLELMQLKTSDPKAEKYLNTAFKACQRGTDLTRRLLSFSRQEQFNAEPCQVNEVIEGLQELFAKSLTSQITLSIELAPDNKPVMLDKGELEDALLNLLLNGRDAMEGKGELKIRTGSCYLSGYLPGIAIGKTQVEPGHYVWISMIDGGSGIPEAFQDKVFDPFFTTKGKSKGTGLGLAMVYGFVKRSKGYIAILNTGAAGTEFRLWFPQSRKLATEPQLSANMGELPRVRRPIKAIVVDDEPEMLEVMADYCDLLGIEAELFHDPITVLQRYEQQRCDAELLITDVLMPGGINGYELAQKLNVKHSLLVLLISGFIQDIGISSADEMPFPVLHKPFDLTGLILALKQVGIRFADDSKGELWTI